MLTNGPEARQQGYTEKPLGQVTGCIGLVGPTRPTQEIVGHVGPTRPTTLATKVLYRGKGFL